jgi:cell division protein ZapA
MAQINIEVNGHPYVVGCEEGQEGRLADLARVVDAHVRGVVRDVGPLGETRLILMGALVMADELAELRAQLEAVRVELAQLRAGAGRAERAAVAALESAAARIEAMAGA